MEVLVFCRTQERWVPPRDAIVIAEYPNTPHYTLVVFRVKE